MIPDDDRTTVRAFLERRDEGAFAALYNRHTPAMYGLALRLAGGESAAAQDIVHDAWVGAAERLAEFRWQASLRTWLCGFVVNGARHRLREALRVTHLSEEAPFPGVDQRLQGVFDRVDLERAIAALSAGCRLVLVLHDVEGYTHEEIATALGIVPGTSKSQLARARTALRRALEPATGG